MRPFNHHFNMKQLLILCFLFHSLLLIAQEKTYGGKEEQLVKLHNSLGSMVIVPFEDRMYLSDADGPIGRETGLDPGELQVKFRNALLESLEQELRKDWDLEVLYDQVVRERGFDLAYIHSSRKYNYVAVSDEVLMVNDTNLRKKDLKATKVKGKSGIDKGEIVTVSDRSEKFMNLQVVNDTLMNYLVRTAPSNFYLFINEFDIRHFVTDPDRIANGGLSYQLKLHFTCLDAKGNTTLAGSATSKVDATNSNIYSVIKAGIPELTEKISRMIRKFNTVDQ